MQHQQQDKRPLLSDSEEANELVSNDDVGDVLVMVMVNENVEDLFNKTMKNNRNELLSIPSPLRHFLG